MSPQLIIGSIAAADIVYATAKHANDRFKAIAASVLPFVFVGKHDPDDHVKEQFQNAWNESVGGSRAILLYLSEIVDLCQKYLDSPQWTLKHTTARSVADAVTTVASLESTMSVGTAKMLWPALERSLAGRTWDGKQVVLPAFVKFVESAKGYYLHEPTVASLLNKVSMMVSRLSVAGGQPVLDSDLVRLGPILMTSCSW